MGAHSSPAIPADDRRVHLPPRPRSRRGALDLLGAADAQQVAWLLMAPSLMADWLPIVAPSPIPEPAHRAYPKAMEDWDIERIVTAYADCAERVKAAGLDGLELEGASHIIAQSWSPRTNRRELSRSSGRLVPFQPDLHRNGLRVQKIR